MPINPDNAEEFDPVHGVPTVSQLLKDLDQSELNIASADMQVRNAPNPHAICMALVDRKQTPTLFSSKQ